MMKFRMWLAALIIWLCVVFNLERLHKPINIASFVYVLSGLLASAIIAGPVMRRSALWGVVAAATVLFVILKAALGYHLLGSSLPLTITEGVVITLTVLLAHQIAYFTHRFEQTASDIATIRWQTNPASFGEAQAEMYRELRRARRFGRPLAIAALEPLSSSMSVSVDQMIQEIRREMIQRYLEVRLAEIIRRESHDCSQIATCNGRFIVLLPESHREHAQEVLSQVMGRVEHELGVKLRMGLAAFPTDEVTLTGLVELAEMEMRRESAPIVGGDPLPPGCDRPASSPVPAACDRPLSSTA